MSIDVITSRRVAGNEPANWLRGLAPMGMAAISVTILPDASLETDAKVSSHLKMTVPASWIQKKRPMRKLLDAALKQWQLTDRSYALRRKDGTALDLDASLGTLEEGAKLVVGVAAAAPVAPPKPQKPAPPKPSKAYATLRSGARIPLCGLGTGGVPGLVGEQCVDIVSHALRSGVRLVDTASQYGNEREVGRALRKSGAPRGEVFLVTKVAPLEQGYAAATASVVRSLERLGVDSVDLVVVHWPGAWVPEQTASRCPRPTRRTRPGGAVGQRDRPGRAATLGCWVLDGIVPRNEAKFPRRVMV